MSRTSPQCPEPITEYAAFGGVPSASNRGTRFVLEGKQAAAPIAEKRDIITPRFTFMGTRTNEEWLRALGSQGAEQGAAIAELRALLLRAAKYSFKRSHYELYHLDRAEILQLAEDSAQDALLAVLKHLDEFRGESKFTTWAYKFAINFSLSRARKETWKRVSLDELLEDTGLPEPPFADEAGALDPVRAAWQAEVWAIVREVMDNELSERQRQVLRLIVFDDVPMDEVAGHFKTNRNAIYKLLHDARRKLKARLEARGLAVTQIIDLFGKA